MIAPTQCHAKVKSCLEVIEEDGRNSNKTVFVQCSSLAVEGDYFCSRHNDKNHTLVHGDFLTRKQRKPREEIFAP